MTAIVTTYQSEHDRVCSELRSAIFLGTYLPGEKLTEVKLAEAFKTSRSTVRICLTMLERDGIVSQETSRGFCVSKISMDETIELLEARARVESYVGWLAAKKISDIQLSKLNDLLAKMRKSVENHKFGEYSQLNTEFHSVIFQSAGNKGLEYVSLQLKTRIIRLQYKIAFLKGRPEQSFKEHNEIYLALSRRDAEKTESLIRSHIEGIKQVILENYGLLEA